MARSYFSTTIDVPLEEVWAVARDFNGLATWWSGSVSESQIEDGKTGDTVGAIRRFTFGTDQIREHQLELSDISHRCVYEFCEPAPFPVTDYVATLQLTPITDGERCFVEWWADFESEADKLDYWRGFFASEVFAPAVEGLRSYLKA